MDITTDKLTDELLDSMKEAGIISFKTSEDTTWHLLDNSWFEVIKTEPHRKDDMRNEIKELLPYMDIVGISDRNKEVVRKYVDGKSQVELGKEYGISNSRIRDIIVNFRLKVRIFLKKKQAL